MASAPERLLVLLFHDVFDRDPSESGFPGPGADRYKLRRREFDSQLGSLARVRADRPVLVPALRAGWGRVPFAITVDDGGVSYYTIAADRLEALGWRGHCFVTTGMIGRPGFLDARQIRELRERGHVIGSHSVSHPARFSACPPQQIAREWADSRTRLADILGEDVAAASVPGGYFSAAVAVAAADAGFRVLFTSEPEMRLRQVGSCTVAGRFTVRPGRAAFARDLGALKPAIRLREFAAWNGKKLLKTCLGAAYPRLARAGR